MVFYDVVANSATDNVNYMLSGPFVNLVSSTISQTCANSKQTLASSHILMSRYSFTVRLDKFLVHINFDLATISRFMSNTRHQCPCPGSFQLFCLDRSSFMCLSFGTSVSYLIILIILIPNYQQDSNVFRGCLTIL